MPGLMENKNKIIGALFLALALFINPLILKQLYQHNIIFGELFLALAFCFYFRLPPVNKKSVGFFEYLVNRHGWVLLLIQAVLFVVYLVLKKDFLTYSLHAGWGDEPSYTGFDFSSWKSVLGNHRTAGLPLIIQMYHLLFKDFTLWPYLQMVCYILSVCYLYWSFLKFGLNRILALFVVSFLLWDPTIYREFLNVQTEVFAAVFVNVAIGSFFWAMREWNWKSIFALTFGVFFLYQIRPNFSFMTLLIPLWAAAILVLTQKSAGPTTRGTILKLSACTILPLILFCGLRLAVVGQFGVVSMSGGCLSGHAVHYLNEQNVQQLSGDVRVLADEILLRKRQLTPPHNLSPFDWIQPLSDHKKIEMEAQAFGPDLMTAWNVGIKQLRGLEPTNDPQKNIEPEKYTLTLSGFYGRNYNFETDRLLSRFSVAILSREWKRYVHWLVGGSFYALRLYLDSQAFSLTCLGLLVIAKLIFLLFGDIDAAQLKRWHRDTGILFMIGFSLFVGGLVPIIVFNFPFARLMNVISFYLVPVLFCLALPPFWLTKKSLPHA